MQDTPGFNFNVEEWDAEGQRKKPLRRRISLAALEQFTRIAARLGGAVSTHAE